MAIVTFLPSGTQVEVAEGERLLPAAQAAGVRIASVCGGHGNCAGCRVKVIEGEEQLSAMGFVEKGRLGNTYFITKERLACQTTVSGTESVVVEVLMEQPRDKRDRARKRALDRTLESAQRRSQRRGGAEPGPADGPPPPSAPSSTPPRAPAAAPPSPGGSEARTGPRPPQDEEGLSSSQRRRRRRRSAASAGKQDA